MKEANQSDNGEIPKHLLTDYQTDHQSEVNDLMLNQLKTSLETADEFKSGLRKSINQIDKGYEKVMRMYEISFYIGISLIIISVILAVFQDKLLLSALFGGLGTAEIISYFLTQPPQKIQCSRADLAQLQAVLFNWFIDEYYWRNVYVRGLYRTTEGADYEDLKKVSTTLLDNTKETIKMIEEYCELKPDRK